MPGTGDLLDDWGLNEHFMETIMHDKANHFQVKNLEFPFDGLRF
jgi:hypothetical protein